MQIGSMQAFLQGQTGKVQMRKEQEKQIKKAVYQMHAMIDSQAMETLDEEVKRNDSRTETQKEDQSADSRKQEHGKTDAKTEMEKMFTTARQIATMKA